METFEATIEAARGGGAYVKVPTEVITALGTAGRIPVLATFDGIEYRGSITSMGGCMALGVLKSIRTKLTKTIGDPITVTVQRDTTTRTIEIPPDLAEALQAAGLQQTFNALSFSHRREHITAIKAAKTPETRTRRITKTIALLTPNP